MTLSKRYQEILNKTAEQLPNQGFENLKVLDIGDYYPILPLYLNSQGAEVTVLDLDFHPETLESYEKHQVKTISFDLNNAHEIEIPTEEKFDVIVWLEVIEHLKCSPIHLFRQFERLLKEDGILILGTPNTARLSSRLRLLFGKHPYQFSLKPFYYGAEQFLGHRREYLISEIDTILDWEGFEIKNKLFYNGTRKEHKKKPWYLVYPYLWITALFPHLRWLYITISKKRAKRKESSKIKLKRV